MCKQLVYSYMLDCSLRVLPTKKKYTLKGINTVYGLITFSNISIMLSFVKSIGGIKNA